jgi:hypothetical protein
MRSIVQDITKQLTVEEDEFCSTLLTAAVFSDFDDVFEMLETEMGQDLIARGVLKLED